MMSENRFFSCFDGEKAVLLFQGMARLGMARRRGQGGST
jgi:hypothetical protein